MFKPIDRALGRLSPGAIAALALLLTILLGFVDHFTGSELSFSIFYTAPIFVATWYAGRRVGLLISVCSAITWLVADLTAGHEYSSAVIPIWNSFVRFGFFSIITVLLAIIKLRLDAEERLADTDPLTELANRRAFNDQLAIESARARRHGWSLTLAFFDIDGFKHVNDSRGHSAGDELLRVVGRTIKEAVRETDLVARLGGDEFAGLFPQTDYVAAAVVLRNLQHHLSSVLKRDGWAVTISMGAVTFDAPTRNISEMLRRADALMYEVKRSGKNNLFHQLAGCDV